MESISRKYRVVADQFRAQIRIRLKKLPLPTNFHISRAIISEVDFWYFGSTSREDRVVADQFRVQIRIRLEKLP